MTEFELISWPTLASSKRKDDEKVHKWEDKKIERTYVIVIAQLPHSNEEYP